MGTNFWRNADELQTGANERKTSSKKIPDNRIAKRAKINTKNFFPYQYEYVHTRYVKNVSIYKIYIIIYFSLESEQKYSRT